MDPMMTHGMMPVQEDLIAGLPVAPLAMPKQILERETRGRGFFASGWLSLRTTRTEG